MNGTRHSGRTDLQKAAIHRELDARNLRDASRWRGAMYLLGYAVECTLKARLMERHGMWHLERLQRHLSRRFGRPVDLLTHSLHDLMEWTSSRHRLATSCADRGASCVHGTYPGVTVPASDRGGSATGSFSRHARSWTSSEPVSEVASMPQRRDTLPGRITRILRARLPAETIIDVSPGGVADNLHVLVVSRDLDGLSEHQKQERLWSSLEEGGLRPNELGRISMILPLSVAELRRQEKAALWTPDRPRSG